MTTADRLPAALTSRHSGRHNVEPKRQTGSTLAADRITDTPTPDVDVSRHRRIPHHTTRWATVASIAYAAPLSIRAL